MWYVVIAYNQYSYSTLGKLIYINIYSSTPCRMYFAIFTSKIDELYNKSEICSNVLLK